MKFSRADVQVVTVWNTDISILKESKGTGKGGGNCGAREREREIRIDKWTDRNVDTKEEMKRQLISDIVLSVLLVRHTCCTYPLVNLHNWVGYSH